MCVCFEHIFNEYTLQKQRVHQVTFYRPARGEEMTYQQCFRLAYGIITRVYTVQAVKG